MEQLREELEQVKLALQVERSKREQLEEECDLLAEDNARLRSELDNARYNTRPIIPPQPPNTSSEDIAAVAVESEVFVEGDGVFAKTCIQTINNASSGKNVLSTAIFESSSPSTMNDIVFVGGVDAHLRGFSMSSGEEMFVKQLSGPVLFIDCQPPYIVCGLMDGSHMVGHLDSATAELSTVESKQHSKYVIGARLSPAATYFATASYDKSVIVYQQITNTFSSSSASVAATADDTNPAEAYEKLKTMQFQETPESIVFASEHELIIGLRGLPHLLYIDLLTFTQRTVSLNEHDWDMHVSFAPLALSISPCNKYLLVATDKHMHLVLKKGTNQRLRILTGHSAGDYGKPCIAWDASGNYIYSNSEEENAVYVYSVATQKVEKRLAGHSGIVRSLAAHATQPGVLVTGSYDKTIKLWAN